jgi:CRP-like cAMP-binding protein
MQVARLSTGASFGELALATRDCYRNASVLAATDTSLIVISREVYLESLQRKTRQEMEDRLEFLRTFPCFKLWNKRKLTALAYAAKPTFIPVRSNVFRAKDKLDGLYFIKSGYCKVLEALAEKMAGRGMSSAFSREVCSRPCQTCLVFLPRDCGLLRGVVVSSLLFLWHAEPRGSG